MLRSGGRPLTVGSLSDTECARHDNGQPLPEPTFSSARSCFMKRFVARCPETDIVIIVAVSDVVAVPIEGTNVSFPCPCCLKVHVMNMRDAKHLREAS